MIVCNWCTTEFDNSEVTVLSITQPNRTDPHIVIHNMLCPSCRDRAWKALAEAEIQIRKEAGNAIEFTTGQATC